MGQWVSGSMGGVRSKQTHLLWVNCFQAFVSRCCSAGVFFLFFANEIKCNSLAADLSVWTFSCVKTEVRKHVYIQSFKLARLYKIVL